MATPLCELVAALKELGLGCLAGASVLCRRSLSGLNRHFSQGFSRLSLAPLDGQCILSSGMGQGRSWESHPRPFRVGENIRKQAVLPHTTLITLHRSHRCPLTSPPLSPLLPALQEPGKQHQVNG